MPKNEGYLKFIHTADLHLGSPFSGISNMDEELAQSLSNAGYAAYDRIIDLAIENEVDFLLISGDIYDSQNKRIREQLKFHKGLERLEQHGINVYIICGNHDPYTAWSKEIKWPDSVHFFQTGNPEVIEYQKNGISLANIVGISYRINSVTENLTEDYPEREQGWPFTIGMLHCNLGYDTDHHPYSPCSIEDLKKKGYNYWALGHIHKPSIINENNPTIIYSGIPQGRDIGETGPRGCYLVTVYDDENIKSEFIETSEIIWRDDTLSIEKMDSLDELRQLIENHLEDIRSENPDIKTICRIKLIGKGRVHKDLAIHGAIQELQEYFIEQENYLNNRVLIEKFIDSTSLPIDREKIMKREDLVADIITISEEMQKSGETDPKLLDEISELFGNYRLKNILLEIEGDEMAELVRDAETYLLDNLIQEDLS